MQISCHDKGEQKVARSLAESFCPPFDDAKLYARSCPGSFCTLMDFLSFFPDAHGHRSGRFAREKKKTSFSLVAYKIDTLSNSCATYTSAFIYSSLPHRYHRCPRFVFSSFGKRRIFLEISENGYHCRELHTVNVNIEKSVFLEMRRYSPSNILSLASIQASSPLVSDFLK